MKKTKLYIGTGIAALVAILIALLVVTKYAQRDKVDEVQIAKGNLGVFTDKEIDELFEDRFDKDAQKHNYLDDYDLIELEKSGARDVRGILCREEDVIVVDTRNNQLLVLDCDGQLLDTVGEMGNGPLEFLNPNGIARQKDKIYILDAGNKRIQVLNSDLTYESEISVPEDIFGKTENCSSIAVDGEGNIFISSTDAMYSKILCYRSADGSFTELGKNFFGTLAEADGKVYAVNIGLAIGENRRRVAGWRSGLNYLFAVTTEGMQMIAELPYGLTIVAFQIVENGVLCLSSGYHTIDLYGLDGSYRYSYGYQEEIRAMGCLSIDQAGGIWFGIPFTGKLYKIEKGGK